MNTTTTPPALSSFIVQGNRALRDKNYEAAIDFYIQALQTTPELFNAISGNIELARKRYLLQKQGQNRQRVAVCGWELAHNAAGRVYTLAKLYETFADVEIIGAIFPMHGCDIWEPIRSTTIPCHMFVVEDHRRFIDQAIQLVAAHPYDIIHLSKPRAPNIFFGVLYKLIWGAKVLIDIDDEELAFVGAKEPIKLGDQLKEHGKLPEILNLPGKDWTRIAVGLVDKFDGITVSNPALQKRYGGEIIRHARDVTELQPSSSLQRQTRNKFNIPLDKKVILFCGTPRAHKGLLETAHALATLQRKDTLFVIVGQFADASLKDELIKISKCDFAFLGNQPITTALEIASIGDIVILPGNKESEITKFQVPAKLSDALLMGLTVIAHETDALADFFALNCIVKVENTLAATLKKVLDSSFTLPNQAEAEKQKLKTAISLTANAVKLKELLNVTRSKEFEHDTAKILLNASAIKGLLKPNNVEKRGGSVSSKIEIKQDIEKPHVQSEVDAHSEYEFKLEKLDQYEMKGWVVKKNSPSSIFVVKILVNQVEFMSIKNDTDRKDLQRHKKSLGKGGLKIAFPVKLFSEENNIISLKLPNEKEISLGNIKGVKAERSHDLPFAENKQNVSIIVPIYNAADDVKICIERIRNYTSDNIMVILINDDSTDQKITTILDQAKGYKNFTVVSNEKNLGFTRTVNRGIELAGDNDVVLLNSDARVTPRWLEGLQAALATDYRIATVTPMSDRAGAFSAPNMGNDNNLPSGIDEISYSLAFRRRSEGLYPSVPTGNGFCMYIRRACIREIGSLDAVAFPRGYGEENDFCMRALNNGWHHVIDDRTYVFHDRSKSFGESKTELIQAGRKTVDARYPEYKKSISIFSESPLIALARFRAKQALRDCLETDFMKPRVLFVVATRTGGTPQTNRDLMLALSDRVEPWLLHCDSKELSVYKVNLAADDELIYRHSLTEPVTPITHVSYEYDRVLSRWLREFDFEVVHIRHLAWHSINLPKIAKESGARVINSFHDFYTVCPTVKLLDENNKFCDGRCTSTTGDCKPDLWAKDAFPSLKNAWITPWRNKFEKSLQYCDAFITTHESAKNTIDTNLEISSKPFYVVPHGRDFDKFRKIASMVDRKGRLRILVPGNISGPKGSKIIEELLALDKGKHLEFHILGKSNMQFNHPRLIFHGEYKREEFSERSAAINPHVGAVFSIWNETWCHTLTELWSVGVPAIVFGFPTLATRVKESGGGWIFDHANLENLYENMVNILKNESEQKLKVDAVSKWQETVGLTQNTRNMADAYYAIYSKRLD